MTPEFDRKGCSNLVSALILLAVKDRRKALMMLKKVPDDKVSVDVEKDTREFFDSDWFEELLGVSGIEIERESLKDLINGH